LDVTAKICIRLRRRKDILPGVALSEGPSTDLESIQDLPS